jgi:exo-beta-1,3-glucanase (GH17 family)
MITELEIELELEIEPPIELQVAVGEPTAINSGVTEYVNIKGDDGDSAYEIAVANGFVGTAQQWLATLQAKTVIRRHDFVANASYCAYAETGSLETAPVWNITKIAVDLNGSTTKTTATNVKWSDRLTLTYS